MENPSRRRVLTAGLTGAVATALVGSRVSATTPTEPPSTEATNGTSAPDSSTSGTTESTTPATEQPTRPTDADVTLLAFAQGAELAAVQLYGTAVASEIEGDGVDALEAALTNHQAAADAWSALLGNAAPQTADAGLVEAHQAAFAGGDLTAVAAAGVELENTMVATYQEMIGQLEGRDGGSRAAAILIAEAQMAAVMADLAGNGDDFAAMFDNSAAALTPSEG